MDDGRDAQGFLTPERARGLFDRAVAHWNAGAYFESHEDWETLWQEAEGAHRAWLQGLIQWAAALHHVKQGTASGFTKLARSATQKTAGYGGDTHGIDFAGLDAALEPWRAHAERVAAGAPLRERTPDFPRIAYRPGIEPAPLAAGIGEEAGSDSDDAHDA